MKAKTSFSISIAKISTTKASTTKASTAELLVCTSLLLVSTTSRVYAAAGHGEPAIGDLTFYWINFVLYVGLLTYILRRPIAKAWTARTARITHTVAQSSDEVEAAERELNAIEALTKTLPQEEEKIKQQIVSQANSEAVDIIQQAEQRAARIRAQARELLNGEMRSAQSSFRQALVTRAVQLAKEKYSAGEFAAREDAYQAAAVTCAQRLV